MGNAWMPGAARLQASADGGVPRGGAPRVVWLTLETDPCLVSARSAAQRTDQAGRAPHIVWNPLSGEIVQLIPALRAGRALGAPDGLGTPPSAAGGESAPINKEGRQCVQIAVVGFAREPFTIGAMTDLELIIWWLDSWHIPRYWPAGPPASVSHARAASPSRRLWAQGGHFGASQVPDCRATGPGAIDIELLTEPAAIPTIEVPWRTRDVASQRREKTVLRSPSQVQLGHLHQPDENAAQLTSTG